VLDGLAVTETITSGPPDVAVRLPVGVEVAVPGVPPGGVFVRVGVRVGVGVGVRVGVLVAGPGVFVRVGVLVGPGVLVMVGVRVWVGLGVGVGVGVLVGVNVGVAVGPITVKVPEPTLVFTPTPEGSVAAAAVKVKAEVPGEALGSTSKTTLATTPSGMTFWLRPAISIGQVPEQLPGFQETSLLAAVAAAPAVMLLTESLELSKFSVKLTPETWAPFCEVSVIGALIPVSPGFPEPSPASMNAVGV
jgi:hypothetical protein